MKRNLIWKTEVGALLFSLLSLTSACTEGNQSSQLLGRNSAENRYFAVGLVTYENIHRCTATIIKHGIALTAKHCFQDEEIEEVNLRKLGLNFPHASDVDRSAVFVRGSQIKKVVFDGPTNDIAYILYDPTATSRLKLDLPLAENPSPPRKDTSTAIIGFPTEEKIRPQFPKVVSEDCLFTGNSDYINPSETESSYDGLLYETTCDVWWGMSGGPALGFGKSGHAEVIGIVAHTFHLTASGEIDENQIKTDVFGHYIPDAVISPLSQTELLRQTLALKVENIPTPSPPLEPSILCGYEDAKALLSEAKNAVAFLKSSASFDPLFWFAPDSSSDVIAMFRDEIKVQNKSFLNERNDLEMSLAWARDVFADYDALLALPDLVKFKSLGIANLGVTESHKECDTLACTDYGSFVVRINKEATSNVFSEQTRDDARKSMKAVLGHELGHFILDFYLLKARGYTSLEEALKELGALKYHLTVDAVGMVLGGYSTSEFAEVLKASLKSEVFGESRLVADSADRAMCLTKLK